MKCPNCKKESVTVLKRLNLRPGKKYTCNECGEKFFISKIHSIIGIMPIFIFGQIQLYFRFNRSLFIIGEIMAVILCIIIHIFFVPLLTEKES